MAAGPDSDLEIEDISSLMRIEKNSGQLSPVRRDLYPAIRALKDKVARECENKDVESLEYDLSLDRKRKLNSNTKQLVEYRMMKVANMALRGAMGTLNTIDQLPQEERDFYEEVLEAAKKLWNAPQKVKKNVHTPEIVPMEEPAPIHVEPVAEDIDIGDIPLVEEMPEPPPEEQFIEPVPTELPEEETQEDENPDADSDELVTVRITETVPPFAGTERNYDLKKEDIVRLPKSLASILIGRKLAVMLNI